MAARAGTSPRKGKRSPDGSWEGQKPNSSRKRRKGNADPEALAHLHPLQDYLKEGLDGACFIPLRITISQLNGPSHFLWNQVGLPPVNHSSITLKVTSPGRMSAETGHHFANPTNHFWRCLHRSGDPPLPAVKSPGVDTTYPDQG